MANSATSVPPMSLTPTLNCSTLGRSFSRSSESCAGVDEDDEPEGEAEGPPLGIPNEEESEEEEYEVAL